MYCHNCGGNGYFRITGNITYLASGQDPLVKPTRELHDGPLTYDGLPGIPVSNYHTPMEYLSRYLSRGMITKAGILYDPSTDRLIYPLLGSYVEPIPNGDELVSFYQLRRMGLNGPKYTTVKLMSDFNRPIHFEVSDTLVIVEDYLSAIKVARAGVGAYCLWGSHLPTTDMLSMAAKDGYKKILVWLDNDNKIVDTKAQIIYTTLSSLGADTYINTVNSDPKSFDVDQIHNLVHDLRRDRDIYVR
jgi:hypothetical protein